MITYLISILASLIIAGFMVYVIDKKFGGTDDSYEG